MCIDHKGLLICNIVDVFGILNFCPNNSHFHTSSIFHLHWCQCSVKANNIHLESNNSHLDIWYIYPCHSLAHSKEDIWHIYMYCLNSIRFDILCICRISQLQDRRKEVFHTCQFLLNSIHCGIWCIFLMSLLKHSWQVVFDICNSYRGNIRHYIQRIFLSYRVFCNIQVNNCCFCPNCIHFGILSIDR